MSKNIKKVLPSKSYSKFNLILILYGLILGVMFYDIISTVFHISFIDELFVLMIFSYSVIRNKISKELIVFLCISLFYLMYSLMTLVNVKQAIWLDFLIQIKPYIMFYCAYSLGFNIDKKYNKLIRRICVLFAIVLIPIGFLSEYRDNFIHPSRFATMCIVLGSLYFYCSSRDNKARNICFAIMSIGLLSLRSKMYGEFAAGLFLFFLYHSKRIRLSLKTIVVILIGCATMVYVTWEKISFYFITGVNNSEMFARPLLYLNSLNVFNDYIPFGSGFGTYATFASAEYYSPLYYKYGMIYSNEIGNGKFISDTFYPALCQFGYVGLFLHAYFWYSIFKTAQKQYLKYHDSQTYKFVIFIIVFFIIESLVDSTFTHNRGVFMMMLLAMYINSGCKAHKPCVDATRTTITQ